MLVDSSPKISPTTCVSQTGTVSSSDDGVFVSSAPSVQVGSVGSHKSSIEIVIDASNSPVGDVMVIFTKPYSGSPSADSILKTLVAELKVNQSIVLGS